MSPTARLRRPLPLVKRVQGDQPQVASPALMSASPSGAASNQSKRPGFARAGWRVGLQSALSPAPRGQTPPAWGRWHRCAIRHGDACAPAVAGGEQRRVPAKNRRSGSGLVKVGVASSTTSTTPSTCRSLGARAPISSPSLQGHGGAHGVQVQPLAFNGAGGDDFLRQHLQVVWSPLRQPPALPCARPACPVRGAPAPAARGQAAASKSRFGQSGKLPEVAGRAGWAVGTRAVIMQVIHRKKCGE